MFETLKAARKAGNVRRDGAYIGVVPNGSTKAFKKGGFLAKEVLRVPAAGRDLGGDLEVFSPSAIDRMTWRSRYATRLGQIVRNPKRPPVGAKYLAWALAVAAKKAVEDLLPPPDAGQGAGKSTSLLVPPQWTFVDTCGAEGGHTSQYGPCQYNGACGWVLQANGPLIYNFGPYAQFARIQWFNDKLGGWCNPAYTCYYHRGYYRNDKPGTRTDRPQPGIYIREHFDQDPDPVTEPMAWPYTRPGGVETRAPRALTVRELWKRPKRGPWVDPEGPAEGPSPGGSGGWPVVPPSGTAPMPRPIMKKHKKAKPGPRVKEKKWTTARMPRVIQHMINASSETVQAIDCAYWAMESKHTPGSAASPATRAQFVYDNFQSMTQAEANKMFGCWLASQAVDMGIGVANRRGIKELRLQNIGKWHSRIWLGMDYKKVRWGVKALL